MEDQTDDWSRLQTALRQQHRLEYVTCSISLLRQLGAALREGDWQVTVIMALEAVDDQTKTHRILDVRPGLTDEDDPLWAVAVDIGTTTVSLWLVDLVTGKVKAHAAEYNGQIARGEDVISRIVYASKNGGGEELQRQVVSTINKLMRHSLQARTCQTQGNHQSHRRRKFDHDPPVVGIARLVNSIIPLYHDRQPAASIHVP